MYFKFHFIFFLILRNIPPKSIAPSGRQKTTLPKEATSILREWLDVNSHRPYPTKEEKESLAKMTKLTVLQVCFDILRGQLRKAKNFQKREK